MSTAQEQVLVYHQRTKHDFHAYARSMGYLDWATQPDPFRRYQGAPLIQLQHIPAGGRPAYDEAFVPGNVSPAPLNVHSISQLFYDSLAISAWKRAEDASWALRVNPSSGNLHPTEGYLICGAVDGLCDAAMVCHYAPREHALERRAEVSQPTWRALTAGLPRDSLLLGLTSIYWREAWKYGERAFRYCQHDVGHALGAVSIAAAGLGWEAALLDDLGTEALADLMGVPLEERGRAEAEHPECVLAIYPQGQRGGARTLPTDVLADFRSLTWEGEPNQLSPSHVAWPIIDEVSAATTKPSTPGLYPVWQPTGETVYGPLSTASLRSMVRQRRSAVALDGRTEISRRRFYHILDKIRSGSDRIPFNTLPWPPQVDLALFVHRVRDLAPGLYFFIRDSNREAGLRSAMRPEFLWERPENCPAELLLYHLVAGDARALAQQLSCHQAIAADGCFSLGMVAAFEGPLGAWGPWFYPRLFWECGMIGQVLYLEAEAAGVRGTGIGCFFDDPVHRVLGLEGPRYQSLYHFTIGGPVEDPRLTTLPAYPAQQV
jgi:SagB-type dehydrogenase family enzyme